MNWNALTNIEQLNTIDAESNSAPVLILKHSTRCSISSAVLARLERGLDDGSGLKAYYLDLIAYREVSNAIATRYGVEHQSPQVIVVKNGKAVYNESHMAIQPADMMAQISSLVQ